MNIQVDYMRLLVGDAGAVQTYTDEQLLSVVVMPPEASVLPAAVQLCGVITFSRFPVPESV